MESAPAPASADSTASTIPPPPVDLEAEDTRLPPLEMEPAAVEVDPVDGKQYVHVPVPVDITIESGADSWSSFTKHMEALLKMMEEKIWPIDPEADVLPHTLMPFVYGTESGEEDENVLKCLLCMLTLGLQGQAFNWKYKFDFDVLWSDEQKGYLVLLNSIRRMWNRGLSESGVALEVGTGAGAGAGAAQTDDVVPPAEPTE